MYYARNTLKQIYDKDKGTVSSTHIQHWKYLGKSKQTLSHTYIVTIHRHGGRQRGLLHTPHETDSCENVLSRSALQTEKHRDHVTERLSTSTLFGAVFYYSSEEALSTVIPPNEFVPVGSLYLLH